MKRKEKRRNGWHIFGVVLLSCFCVVGVLAMVALGVVAVYVDSHTTAHIDMTLFRASNRNQGSTLYYYKFADRENRIGEEKVLTTLRAGGGEDEYVSYDAVPQALVDAFVAIEDQHFWEHRGVNWPRSVLAIANYFLKFRRTFGASTITQQLIKNITGEDEQTPQRKMQEIRWALDLESQLDKREIMEMYLNIINLANGCFGVGSAADYYFSKDVSDLNLAECATIAGITNNPAKYNPVTHPEDCVARRNLILGEMLELEMISYDAYCEAKEAALVLQLNEKTEEESIQSWYVDMVVEDVIEELMQTYGYTSRAASLMLYYGGLKIYTAMDADVQRILEEYYLKDSHFPDGRAKTPMQSAMIVIDPVTGDILGVVGARREKQGNRVQSYATDTVRPAGSSIKPLSVYAPALEAGLITYGSVVDDTPVNFGNYNLDSRLGSIVKPVAWPKNSPNIYRGLITVNQALTYSTNTVSVKLLNRLSVEKSFRFLHDSLEMESLIERRELENGRILTDMDVAALALGQQNYGVTVRELTAAYSVFANGGTFNRARSFYSVKDRDDNVLLSNPYNGKQVISEQNAYIMTKMLQNVVASGTAKDITLDKYIPVAGKTGTTQNDSDKWFIGYTPYFIGGVWCGYEYPTSLSKFDGNPCLDIWNDIMWTLHRKYLTGQEKIKGFEMPSGIVRATYCKDSGKLMTSACYADPRGSRAETGYFVKGSTPSAYCDCHVLVDYDGVLGGVATEETPYENIVKVGMIQVKRDFPMQVYISDAQYVWRPLSGGTARVSDPNMPFFAGLQRTGHYFGISYGEQQYNRAAEKPTEDPEKEETDGGGGLFIRDFFENDEE